MVAADDKSEPFIAAPGEHKCGDITQGYLPDCPGKPGRCCNPMIHKINSFETKWHRCIAIVAFLSFWWILFRGIIQFIMFHYATMGCSESALADYRYAGGGWLCPDTGHCVAGSSFLNNRENWPACVEHNDTLDPHHEKCKYSPHDNVVPEISLLLHNEGGFMGGGGGYNVYPATPGTATIDQAQVGMWWRTWGPWFYTYTYQDMHGRTTLYMRPTIIGMWAYSETRIMRCDGAGDVWFFGEGSNWIQNRIRNEWSKWFGSQRSGTFNIYKDSAKWGSCQEEFQGPSKSISCQKGTGDTAEDIGSGILTANTAHGNQDLWSVHKNGQTNYRDFPPLYVMNAATTLMAYHWRGFYCGRHASRNRLAQYSCPNTPAASPSPNPPAVMFLAGESNITAATFVEDSKEAAFVEDGEEAASTEADQAIGERV